MHGIDWYRIELEPQRRGRMRCIVNGVLGGMPRRHGNSSHILWPNRRGCNTGSISNNKEQR